MTNTQGNLLGSLVGLARAMDELTQTEAAHEAMLAGLRAMGSGSEEGMVQALDTVRRAKRQAVPDCFICMNPCGRTADMPPEELNSLEAPVRRGKYALLGSLIRYAMSERKTNPQLLTQGLFCLGYPWFTQEEIEEIQKSIEKEI